MSEMTFRSRFCSHNPFRRRKNSRNEAVQTEGVNVAGDSAIVDLPLAPPSKSTIHLNQSTQCFMPEDLWLAAYNWLSDDERRVLSTSSNEETAPTSLLISEVIQSTEEQYKNFQQRVDEKLREYSQKIINAALSFKDIVGAVVASDPTHHAAGVWAIVSLGLTVWKEVQIRSALANLYLGK
jgi:hypothetical protein